MRQEILKKEEMADDNLIKNEDKLNNQFTQTEDATDSFEHYYKWRVENYLTLFLKESGLMNVFFHSRGLELECKFNICLGNLSFVKVSNFLITNNNQEVAHFGREIDEASDNMINFITLMKLNQLEKDRLNG